MKENAIHPDLDEKAVDVEVEHEGLPAADFAVLRQLSKATLAERAQLFADALKEDPPLPKEFLQLLHDLCAPWRDRT